MGGERRANKGCVRKVDTSEVASESNGLIDSHGPRVTTLPHLTPSPPVSRVPALRACCRLTGMRIHIAPRVARVPACRTRGRHQPKGEPTRRCRTAAQRYRGRAGESWWKRACASANTRGGARWKWRRGELVRSRREASTEGASCTGEPSLAFSCPRPRFLLRLESGLTVAASQMAPRLPDCTTARTQFGPSLASRLSITGGTNGRRRPSGLVIAYRLSSPPSFYHGVRGCVSWSCGRMGAAWSQLS